MVLKFISMMIQILLLQIDAGDYYLIPPQNYTTLGSTISSQGSTMYVRTQDKNHPVFAYQGVGGSGDSSANQGMFFVPPISDEANDDVNNIPSIDFIGATALCWSIWCFYCDK